MSVPPSAEPQRSSKKTEERESVVVRFAGDSGDGMQLTGMQFTTESALAGNDIGTLPGLSRRDPRTRRHARRRQRLPAELLEPRGLHAGRRPRRAGRDESGGAEGQPRRPARAAASSSSTRRRSASRT